MAPNTKRTGTPRRPAPAAARCLAIISVAAVVGALFAVAPEPVPPAPASATTTDSPGQPQPGIPVYSEDFSGMAATHGAIDIRDYTGSDAAAHETYRDALDPGWTPAADLCDGWVLKSTTPVAASDSGCTQYSAWSYLTDLAIKLGQAQGQSVDAAKANQALSEYTNGGDPGAGVMFRTDDDDAIEAAPGHYYAVSAWVAAANCSNTAGHPKLTFSLIVNGVQRDIGTDLDACGSSSGTAVTQLRSDAIQVPAGSAAHLGLRLYNATATGAGNDFAFDLPQIVDVTPRLDASFSPALVAPGQTSTVTLIVTNTDDLKAKNDWSLSDDLPAGLVIAPGPALGGTCQQKSGDPLVRTATPGSSSFSLTGGDLAAGDAACTVTFDVASAADGSYGIGDLAATGLTLPLPTSDPAPLTVRAPRITLAAALDAPREADGGQVAVQLRTGGPNGAVVSDASRATTAGTGPAVDAGTGTTGSYTATPGTAYWLTETAAGTTNLADYSSSISCSDAYGLQSGLPQGPFDPAQPPVVTAVAGAAIECTITSTAQPIVEIAASAGSVTGPDPHAVYTARYTVTATNSGSTAGSYGPLTDTPAFAAAATASSASWTASGPGAPPSGSAAGSGPYELTSGATAIAAHTTQTFQVAIAFRLAATGASACAGPGTGLFSSVLASGATTSAIGGACDMPPGPALSVVESAGPTTVTRAGETVTYSFLVTNTGDVAVGRIAVETSSTGTGRLAAIECPSTVLAPGGAEFCAAQYRLTQTDIESGAVHVTALAQGLAPDGRTPVVSPPSSAVVSVQPASGAGNAFAALRIPARPRTIPAATNIASPSQYGAEWAMPLYSTPASNGATTPMPELIDCIAPASQPCSSSPTAFDITPSIAAVAPPCPAASTSVPTMNSHGCARTEPTTARARIPIA